ncbi:serine/threonine-protein kinase [Frigoribacterium faeni]|uniref:non-specific serine/threonine protein kinase n=1 Tax=Frigoribacterium faeni TaxID=145483 RepID=A0A7W3PJN3_9MICO|nr:serine/threonine-protein kinase [Frigoribacterium faeni]MBA8813944.1 serine/threonine-protein kinase [Frigoribacterium faeni]GEK82081.1 hypothetical protein FFA01_03900 [Frigoribacterium faeni]
MAQSRSGEALGASYRLVELIGTGAVGEVWRVSVAGAGETEGEAASGEAAAKLLKPEHADDSALVERFVRERSVLLSLRHPGIVRVRDLVVEGDRLAIVMDLVPGGSVGDLLARSGPLPARDALTLAAEVFDALSAAHARQVTHRDVKPDNVLLAEPWRPGLTGAVRVGDFGIASVVDEKLRQTTGLLGTPQYMSPELISQGRSGAAGDVYATGVMLYELLAGRTPFAGPGTDFTVAYRHVTSTPPRLDLPDDLWAALESLLSKDPAVRPSAADAASTVRSLAGAHAGLAALPAAVAPDGFADVERPATIVRGAAAGAVTPGTIPGGASSAPQTPAGADDAATATPPAEPLPDLGSAGSATIVRPLRRPVGAPASRPDTAEEARSGRRPAWLTNRTIALAAVGVVLVAALVVGLVWLLPSGEPEATPTAPHAATASQRDPALPTGLSITRDASYDPAEGTVALTLDYAAQSAPLTGPLLEVVPGVADGDGCPPVTWTGATATRNQPSVTGVTADCAWTLTGVDVPAGGQVEITATLPATFADGAALDAWLDGAAAATTEATTDETVTGTSYPAQRLLGVQVVTPSRTVSQTPLTVTLVPVWAGGPDELNPLYSSPSTGSPSQMLVDVAGGEAGVRFADGCAGALAVSSDGLVVTALSVAPSCVLRATVGNFTNLESSPFSITTRE